MRRFFIIFLGSVALTTALPVSAQIATTTPSIYALSPASGPVGTTVTIQGSGFSLDTVNNISIDGGGGSYSVAALAAVFNCPMIPANATSTSCGAYTDILTFTMPTAVGPYCPPSVSSVCAMYARAITAGLHTVTVIRPRARAIASTLL